MLAFSGRLQAQQYTITDLGLTSYSLAINNSMEVVGTQSASAFQWVAGSFSPVGTLGTTSFATNINSAGQIVGYSYDGNHLTAFISTNHVLTPLGYLGGGASYATAVNDSGIVVGSSPTQAGGNYSHAFVWRAGILTDLTPQYPVGSKASGINNSNLIVGSYNSSAFKLQLGGTIQILPDLPGHSLSAAAAVNDHGLIVGYSQANGGPSVTHAVLWTENGIQDLGTLGGSNQSSMASDINLQGEIIGTSNGHAFVYDSANGMQDLNVLINPGSGWVLNQAESINDFGDVVGLGTLNGVSHAFLVTPVPEASWTTIPFAGIFLLVLARRRRNLDQDLFPSPR